MALAAITGLPLIYVGAAQRQGVPSLALLGNTVTIDATNEAAMMFGRLYWEDGGTHTVDTTGSSSIQWMAGAVTFANAGTTFKVGIAAPNTTTGPPARAVNVSDVITFDVSADFTGGGGGVTTGAWNTSVPTTGTKSIATGDLIVVGFQMTARAGVDSIIVQCEATAVGQTIPATTNFTGGGYGNSSALPNTVVVASDGTRGYIYGSFVSTTGSTNQTWNNTSGTKEYGNIFRLPFPARAYGIYTGCAFAADVDLILYSDPLGTPVAQRTVSVDLNVVASSVATGNAAFPFSSSYDMAANTDYAVIAKPSSASNLTLLYKTYNIAAHQNSEPLGTGCYAINRNTGAFAAQNSSKDRFAIGVIVGAFDAGGGGSAGILGSANLSGGML